jgi:hypothetical protein
MSWGEASFIMTVGGALLLVGMLITKWSRRHGRVCGAASSTCPDPAETAVVARRWRSVAVWYKWRPVRPVRPVETTGLRPSQCSTSRRSSHAEVERQQRERADAVVAAPTTKWRAANPLNNADTPAGDNYPSLWSGVRQSAVDAFDSDS